MRRIETSAKWLMASCFLLLLFSYQNCSSDSIGELSSQSSESENSDSSGSSGAEDDEPLPGEPEEEVMPPAFSTVTGFSGATNERTYGLAQDGSLNIYRVGQELSAGAVSGERDALISKISSDGQTVLWSKVFEGSLNDQFFDVVVGADGHPIAGGLTISYGSGSADILIVKFNAADGSVIWSKVYGGSESEHVNSMSIMADGGLLIAAHTSSMGAGGEEALLLKLDANGNQVFGRYFGGAGNERFLSAIEASNGDLVAVGRSESYSQGLFDGLIARFNSAGGLLWARSAGGTNDNQFYSVAEAPNGDSIVSGKLSEGSNGSADGWLARVTPTGTFSQGLAVGGGNWEELWDVLLANDQTFVVSGITTSFGGGGSDAFLIKVAADFSSIVFSYTYGGMGDDAGIFNPLIERADNGYLMTLEDTDSGTGDRDSILVQTSHDGTIDTGNCINYRAAGAVMASVMPSVSVVNAVVSDITFTETTVNLAPDINDYLLQPQLICVKPEISL